MADADGKYAGVRLMQFHKENRMYFRFQKQIKPLISVFLAGLMALSCIACGGKPQTPSETEDETDSAESTQLPDVPDDPVADRLYYINTEGKPMLRAAYVGRKACTPLSVALRSDGDVPNASVGATWTSEGVTVIVSCDRADSISVRIGEAVRELTADAGGCSSAAFSFTEMNVKLIDLGQPIPLTVTVSGSGKSAGFDGFAILCDYDTFAFTDFGSGTSLFQAPKLSCYQSTAVVKNADAGAGSGEGSLLIYDRYTPDGKNYAHLRNQVSTIAIDAIEAGTKNLLTEFDITIEAMPVYEWLSFDQNASYGLSFVLSEQEGGTTVMVGFLNTEAGIGIYVNGRNSAEGTDSSSIIYTGKKIGEQLHVGFIWSSGNIDVFLDGAYLATFENVNVSRSAGFGNHTASFVWQRNATAPGSEGDNFVARIDNLGFAFLTEYSLIHTITVDTLLGKDYRRVEGDDVYLASSDLALPTVLTSSKYGLNTEVIWRSSDPSVITADGKVIPQDGAGEFADLTAYLADGDKIVSEKRFSLFVKAADPSTNVLWLKNDVDPFSGVAVSADTSYIVDGVNNSIVYDMGSVTDINRAVLNSLHAQNRVTGNFVALYASNDNRTYTAIPEFCTLRTDGKLYFYNFSVRARYLKIHFTFPTVPASSLAIYNSLQKAMSAYYSTEPLLDGGGNFAKSVSLTVKNGTSQPLYNQIRTYTLADLGISATDLKADLSDIRFRCNGMELPHYYANGIFYVRVMEIPANSSVTVDVLYGNSLAESVSDGVAALEIEYGTKTVSERPAGEGVAWRNSVAIMPDGSLVSMGPYDGNGYLGMERSTDGGHTWTKTKKITTIGSSDGKEQGGGFLVDYENSVVYFLAYKNNGSGDMYILKTIDSGESWTVQQKFQGIAVFTYSDGIRLSCHDGDGPNIDYVFTVMLSSGVSDGTDWSCYATSLYSRDNGATWTLSDSRIEYGSLPENTYWASHESGVSEETVWEKADGTLILYARYQGYDDINQTLNLPHFIVAYSYDHGVTWTDIRLSGVYATNTQPILAGLDGIPLLLWGGNNSAAFRSYDRFPLNVAYSVDDAETFIGIMDISFQTEFSNRIEYRPAMEKYIVTNPDIAVFEKGGVDCAFILITNYRILIENFSNYLYQSKGAFDSFEQGDIESEGWVSVSGTPVDPGTSVVPGELPAVTENGATEGKYAMQLGSYTKVSRSVPFTKKGELFFDLSIERLGGGMSLELQSAYNRNPGVAAPVRIWISSTGDVYCYNEQNILSKTSLQVTEGKTHCFSVVFDGESGTAALTIDGKRAEITFNKNVGDYICFVFVDNAYRTSLAIDRFGLVG